MIPFKLVNQSKYGRHCNTYIFSRVQMHTTDENIQLKLTIYKLVDQTTDRRTPSKNKENIQG